MTRVTKLSCFRKEVNCLQESGEVYSPLGCPATSVSAVQERFALLEVLWSRCLPWASARCESMAWAGTGTPTASAGGLCRAGSQYQLFLFNFCQRLCETLSEGVSNFQVSQTFLHLGPEFLLHSFVKRNMRQNRERNASQVLGQK